MLAMLRDLVHHKNYANAALLNAIAEHEQASADPELRQLVHHIILANRYWLALFAGHPFDIDNESKVPESYRALATLYRDTHEREVQWLNGLHDSDLDRVVATPFMLINLSPWRKLSCKFVCIATATAHNALPGCAH